MPKIRVSEDIRPLSELGASTAAFIGHVRTTGRPLVLTQHGRNSAVLLDVAEYERLVERVEVLEDIRTAGEQLARGEGASHESALDQVRSRLPR